MDAINEERERRAACQKQIRLAASARGLVPSRRAEVLPGQRPSTSKWNHTNISVKHGFLTSPMSAPCFFLGACRAGQRSKCRPASPHSSGRPVSTMSGRCLWRAVR
ncbi:hypothetical protein TcCL_ESM11499 [Trypanosoma cruzi]|nr:hypothetical protein TcCL_ESM11499 [Trypanosoma cruzi]